MSSQTNVALPLAMFLSTALQRLYDAVAAVPHVSLCTRVRSTPAAAAECELEQPVLLAAADQ